MKMFLETVRDLGKVKVGVEIAFEYPYDELYLFKTIVTPCECTKVYHIPKEKLFRVKYIPKEIPPHLRSQGWYETTKKIVITYQEKKDSVDETVTTLVFSAKIVR